MSEQIYLDHAATTPVDPAVAAAMWPYFGQVFANASSRYPQAEQARAALDWAHGSIADAIGARPGEIVLTSGGSESDNLAIKGVALAAMARGKHIVTTAVEHHAVLRACEYLEERHGFRVTYLPVDGDGVVDVAALERALDDETVLVSVMLANNEVGTVQPIAAVAALTKPRGIVLHCDAVQAAPYLPIDVNALGVDLLALSAHKCYGPKGVGALYVRRGVRLDALIHGGHQERDRRAGTENVAGAVGLATALGQMRAQDVAPLQALRDTLIAGVLQRVPGALLTGHPMLRLANHASFCFPGVAGETVLIGLADAGIACSSGSACAAGETEPSHVLTAMGIAAEVAQTAVRLTLGWATTAAEIARVLDVLPAVVAAARGDAVRP